MIPNFITKLHPELAPRTIAEIRLCLANSGKSHAVFKGLAYMEADGAIWHISLSDTIAYVNDWTDEMFGFKPKPFVMPPVSKPVLFMNVPIGSVIVFSNCISVKVDEKRVSFVRNVDTGELVDHVASARRYQSTTCECIEGVPVRLVLLTPAAETVAAPAWPAPPLEVRSEGHFLGQARLAIYRETFDNAARQTVIRFTPTILSPLMRGASLASFDVLESEGREAEDAAHWNAIKAAGQALDLLASEFLLLSKTIGHSIAGLPTPDPDQQPVREGRSYIEVR